MSESVGGTVLSLFETKDALLYFKHVIPLTYIFDALLDSLRTHTIDTPWSFQDFGISSVGTFIDYLMEHGIPPELRTKEFFSSMQEIGDGHHRVLFSRYWRSDETQKREEAKALVENFFGPAAAMLARFSIHKLPIVSSPRFVEVVPSTTGDLAVTLASLKLIDTTRTPLPHIYEFRRDEEAMRKLRRLRTFVYENYRDKPRTFMEDDLLTRISEYEATVKQWGFETKAAVFTALLDSKLIAGGIAGSFLAQYLGSPLLTLGATLGATGLTIGKITIELGRRKFAYRETLSNNPVSYIVYANEKLEPKPS